MIASIIGVRNAVIRALLSSVMLATPVAAAADTFPMLKYEESCRQVAAIKGGIVTSKEQCMAQEQSARDQLRGLWAQFHQSDQKLCVSQTNLGGIPSYAELLACLVTARDARALESGKRDSTVGSGNRGKN